MYWVNYAKLRFLFMLHNQFNSCQGDIRIHITLKWEHGHLGSIIGGKARLFRILF